MLVWALFIGAGIGFLITVAIMIGRSSAEDYAWRAIAAERRVLQQRRRAERERELAEAEPGDYS